MNFYQVERIDAMCVGDLFLVIRASLFIIEKPLTLHVLKSGFLVPASGSPLIGFQCKPG